METLFEGAPIETSIFYYDDLEIAYVVFEDEGDYWSILASLGDDCDEKGSIHQVIDKNIIHPSPQKYATEQYELAVNFVLQVLKVNVDARSITIERCRWA